MGDTTAISWADRTFNPWIGCTKVSVGAKGACEGCYAEAMMADRYQRVTWGKAGQAATYSRTALSNWKRPRAWDRKAATDGTRPFVFCASLADVFDNQVPPEWRRDLLDLIRLTPNLTWLLLTKRPQNILKLFRESNYGPDGDLDLPWPRNAAIGCTVVTQSEADRDIPWLLEAKAALKPAFAFVSMEPLMEAVDISPWLGENPVYGREQAERGVRLSGSGLRGLGDHAGRNDLESAETRLGSLAEQGGQPALQAGSSGEAVREERLLFPGHDHDGRQAGLRAGSPSGLSTLQGADPGGHDGQPRGREEEVQPSGQPGTGDALGTAEARREGLGRLPSSEPGLSWIIVGGETDQGSHRARPVHPGWVRSLRDQCAAAGTVFHFKQWGSWHADALLCTDMQGRCPPPNMHIGAKRAGRALDGVIHDARPRP